MKTTSLVLSLCVCIVVGCSNNQDQTTAEKKKDPNRVKPNAVNRLGINLDQSGGGQSSKGTRPPVQRPPQKQKVDDGKGIIGKTTNEIVDLHKALAENPKLKIDPNRATGSDPLTYALDQYVPLAARVSMLGFKKNLQITQALNGGKTLSFEEMTKMMKDYQLELAMLPYYKKYAYDSKTGEIVILIDPDLEGNPKLP